MIFDGHMDLWTHINMKRQDKKETHVFKNYHLEQFQKGGVCGGIFAMWIDKDIYQNPMDGYRSIVSSRRDEIRESPDIFQIVKNYHDLDFNSSKILAVTGIEGLDFIGEDIDYLEHCYQEAEARHATLTWNNANDLATPWAGDPDRGLTAAGKQAVAKMEALGMLLDVSHLNAQSFWDIASCASKPFVASHSNVKSIQTHGRNLTDEQIKEIAKTGGLIGMNAYKGFIHEDPKKQDIDTLCNHIAYIADLVGTEYIALGFDFMYYLESDSFEEFSPESENACANGLGCPAEAANLLPCLKEKGFLAHEIAQITHQNYERLFKKILKES